MPHSDRGLIDMLLSEPSAAQRLLELSSMLSGTPGLGGLVGGSTAPLGPARGILDVEGPGTAGLTYGEASPKYMRMSQSVWEDVSNRFGRVTNKGIWTPGGRPIAGTSTPSEHSYGAAVDIGIPNERYGLRVYDWLKAKASQYGITNILFDPAGAPGANPGAHTDHLHVGFLY